MGEVKIKPCPFCGGEAEYHECNTDYPTEHKDCYIRCASCLARIERNTKVEDKEMKFRVISLWNRRTERSENDAEIH